MRDVQQFVVSGAARRAAAALLVSLLALPVLCCVYHTRPTWLSLLQDASAAF
jgi:hypothetical protein